MIIMRSVVYTACNLNTRYALWMLQDGITYLWSTITSIYDLNSMVECNEMISHGLIRPFNSLTQGATNLSPSHKSERNSKDVAYINAWLHD